jgi:hypothetical protein
MTNSLEDLRPPIRLLLVTDGQLHFGPTKNGFSFTELITKGLTGGINPWPRLEITTARRLDDDDCEPNCTPNQCFRFDGELFKNGKFDEVWLFGQLEERDCPLDPSEVKAVLDFMDAGGGVFATGDHWSLGAAMCGQLPRVGSMRKWYYEDAPSLELKAPGKEDTTRLDTLREGRDLGFQMDDQSDNLPQEIRPKFFLNPGGQGAKPHPLLADRCGFAITVLPDHMHEGECMVPSNLERTFEFGGKRFDEYPAAPDTDPKLRVSPQVVAISTSASGYILSAAEVLPVEPKCFASIVAYWGDQVNVGRVAVDSSFHHFLDINLRGTGANNPAKVGYYDCHGNPTKDYESFKQYYRNMVGWLCAPQARAEMYRGLLFELRFNTFLIEELTPTPEPTITDYLYAGAVTRKVITERFSEAEVVQCCLALVSEMPPEKKLAIEGLINPWLPSPLRLSELDLIVNPEFVTNLLLGAPMVKIATELPSDLDQAFAKLMESRSTAAAGLARVVTESLQHVTSIVLTGVLQKSAIRLNGIAKTL